MRKLRVRSAVAVAVGLVAYAEAQDGVRVTVEGGGCAKTPAAAIQAAKGLAGALQISQVEGYRVQAVRWDPLQRQSWAVIRSCAHPELPGLTVLTDLPPDRLPSLGLTASAAGEGSVPSAGSVAAVLSRSAEIVRQNAAVAVVKVGEIVRLWKSDRNSRIELIATAEENGAVGSRVRVRLMTRRETNGVTDAPQYLAGVVRGPADVEIEP